MPRKANAQRQDCLSAQAYATGLDREFLGQGEAAAYTEGFAGDFQTWGSLFAFVFVLIYAQGYGADQVKGEIEVVGDFFGAADVFYVGFEDTVEDGVIWQGILIFLIGAQLG